MKRTGAAAPRPDSSAAAARPRPRSARSARNGRAVVPFAALERQHAALREELQGAFERVVGASAFILGEEVESFERAFAGVCGTRECVGVGSGTAAIALALIAAGVGPGDEVIVPAHTFIASAVGVLHAGATPVFCDVRRETGLIDPAQLEHVIGPHTAAVIAVHLYGQPCEMEQISSIARRHGVFVLEDAAQAHGASLEGRPVGSLGNAAAFSFYPSKNLGALGDGGAVCTNDPALADHVRQLRDLGRRGKDGHVLVGFNERLDGIQAALLNVKLAHLRAWNASRRRHAAWLRRALPSDLFTLRERVQAQSVFHLFPVRHRARERLAQLLRAERIAVAVHYTPATHRHPAFDALPARSRPLALPEAEAWSQEELSLPMFAELREQELERIAAACARACDQLRSEDA